MSSASHQLKKRFAATAEMGRLIGVITAAQTHVGGLHGSSKSLCCALLAEHAPLVIVARDDESAEVLYDDLTSLLDEPPFLFELPRHIADDPITAQREMMDKAITLHTTHARVLVLPPAALGLAFPPTAALDRATMTIRQGDLYEIDALVATFTKNGYQRKPFVEEEGDLAVRGGLIDIFPIAAAQPVRIEMRDIEIESLRTFDVLTQRSIRPSDLITIPLGLAELQEGAGVNTPIVAYLPTDALYFIDEPAIALAGIEDTEWRAQVQAAIATHSTIVHSLLGSVTPSTIRFETRPQPRFGGAVKQLEKELNERTAEGYTVSVFAETNEHAKRLRDLLEESAVAEPADGTDLSDPSDPTDTIEHVFITPAHDIHPLAIAEGFVMPGEKWAVYTEHELFDRRRISRKPRAARFQGFTLRELRRLEKGDYVVHVDKGIGKFTGMETITVHGTKQECVKLLYRDSDVLFVHLNHIDRLQKYVSKEGKVPTLSRLGGTEWVKAKERMKAKAMEIAQKLLQIHARRKVEKGFAFSPDNHWQRELEASFMYDDTPDQHRATEEVKRDMENRAPMDRLVCGDVGYGKTEVACRAAFKAVQDGKQVAVLVPTTILAQQHFNTFHDRLEKYAVKVEVLSRFRTKAEQKAVIERLEAGDVDVLIGTHRLLSKDVVFKDLGLLIIDEEQRFGVTAKEKLRERKSTVDTLTLTATPIPRTMNLSLVGLRDISVIETPPPNRRPIQTEIIPWDAEIIRRAVLHEIHRGGQCFFVHDHVNSINQLVEKIHKAVPEARIGVGHGQMSGPALEKVMMDFMMKRIDVLVCTKIVESGLDIASANTILINRAENFGLAELYQLRGRVGRSNVQAHAYCIVPPLATLTTTAMKRLYALEEFTDLGSGFQLAMRDLELRGAGTILGGEQSGFIDALGFELYLQLLEQAVRELKAKEYQEIFANELSEPVTTVRRDVQVQVNSDALIPSFYVPDDTERFDLYKRLYQADNEPALQKIRDELQDRFGDLPAATESLFRAVRLKNIAARIGFDKVIERSESLSFELSTEDAATDAFYLSHFDAVMNWVKANGDDTKLAQKNQTLQVTIELNGRDALDVALRLMEEVVSGKP